MLSTILGSVGLQFINGFFDTALKAFTAYENKQITKEQCMAQVNEAMLSAAKDVEVAAYNALASTYGSFMNALAKSVLMQKAWVATVFSQLFVLTWHQFFIPIIVILVHWYWGDMSWKYPSSGTTVEWAYLLLAGLMGMAPVVMQAGPGAGNVLERMRAMIK